MNSTANLNHSQWDEFLNRSTATIAIETSILLLIGTIAIAGNLLVVISIYRNPSLRTITNYLVLSLAITDLLYPVLGLSLTLFWSVKSRFDAAQELCDFQAICVLSLTHISAYSMALMAVNRYYRVCKPHRYQHVFNKKVALSLIGAMWMFCFFGVVFVVAGGSNVARADFFPGTIMCGLRRPRDSNPLAYNVFANLSIVVTIALPFAIIVYCYFKVFKKIREHKKNIAPSSDSSSLGTSVHEIKVTWTLFAVLMGYVFTWVPVLLILVLSNFSKNLPRQVLLTVTYMTSCSSAINPMIYGAMNTAFRREYTKIVQCG